LDASSIKEAIWYQCASNGKDVAEQGSVNMRAETNLSGMRSYAVATLVGESSKDTITDSSAKAEKKTGTDSLIIDSKGNQYTLAVIDIASESINERLSTQPWWGDAALAEEFARLSKLVAPKAIQPCMSASFAYGLDASSIKEAIWYQCASNGKDVAEQGSVNMRAETGLDALRSYVVATLVVKSSAKSSTATSTATETKTKTDSKTETKTRSGYEEIIKDAKGNRYSVSIIDIASTSLIDELSGQPWWGDAALAEEFARLAKLMSGVQSVQPCVGASFAYGLDETSIKEALWYQCGANGQGIAEQGSVNIRSETNLTGVRSYVKAVLIPPLEVKALSSTSGPTEAVSITGGILSDKDGYNDKPSVGETVKILFTLSPAADDVEAQTEIFIAISLGGNYFSLTPTGAKVWDGQLPNLEAFANVVLKAHMKIDVLGQYGGSLKLTEDMVGTYYFYLAYTGAGGGLIFNQDPLVLEIK